MTRPATTLAIAALAAGCGFEGEVKPDAPMADARPDGAILAPVLVPETWNFGDFTPGTPATEVFTVAATSPTQTLTASISGTNAGDFTITADSCTGHALTTNASCTITVQFLALAQTGARDAELHVVSAGGLSLTSGLTGRYDVLPTLTPTPTTTLAFDIVNVGFQSPTKMVAYVNNGTRATPEVNTTKGGSADFAITSDTCAGQMIQPHAMCIIQMTFAPNIVGDQTATLDLAGGVATAHTLVTGNGRALTIEVTPADFGPVVTGRTSTAKHLSVTNVAANSVGPLLSSLAGNHPGDFAISADTCNTVTLAALGTCTLDVTFTPTVDGARNALVRFTVGTTIIADGVLLGSGVPDFTNTINPTAFAFPDTAAGATSTAQTFTLTNPGGAPSGTITTALTGTDPTQFTIVTDTCNGTSLQPAGSCTVDVAFKPTTAGAKSASLALTSSPGGTATAALSGTGL